MPATNLCPLTNDDYGMKPFLSPKLEAAQNLALTTVGLLGDWGSSISYAVIAFSSGSAVPAPTARRPESVSASFLPLWTSPRFGRQRQ